MKEKRSGTEDKVRILSEVPTRVFLDTLFSCILRSTSA